jgi:asparagine synthase (glutamine-hydrolysing)
MEAVGPYGPDDGNVYSRFNIGILYRAFHTTKESRLEAQPYVTGSGLVITWDGRLDNRAELIGRLSNVPTAGCSDILIVAAAYEQWGVNCFAMLAGDWALAIWIPRDRSLILAKDPIGTRHLYYSLDRDQVTWSTTLDPLVMLAGRTFALNEEYIAGWFAACPEVSLTPYLGVHSVPPSSFVLIRAGMHTVSKYWEFDPEKKIRYRTDADYEEHFRTVFALAVRRRLRADSPVLAELSGGMDSSSIVCMADDIIARGAAETLRLDTVSYYDDAEPNWNERPYFTRVEEKRGRIGCHIPVGSQEQTPFGLTEDRFVATPGGDGGRPSEARKRLADCIALQGYRVVLSGVGGDEVTGGVPTPTPELEDLVARARLAQLAHQLKVWALNKRKPWLDLLIEALRRFLPPVLVDVPTKMGPASWLHPSFIRLNRIALLGYQTRTKLFGPLPSFQENISALNTLRRQLHGSALTSEPLLEKRYPYLDCEFLEFIYAIPREQLLRPGQRRSLMRRAFTGLVPDEILNRKRKAFVFRGPMDAISKGWENLGEFSEHMVSGSLGIIDSEAFAEAWQQVHKGSEVPLVPLLRTLSIELWLRGCRTQKILSENRSSLARMFLRGPQKQGIDSPTRCTKSSAS